MNRFYYYNTIKNEVKPIYGYNVIKNIFDELEKHYAYKELVIQN